MMPPAARMLSFTNELPLTPEMDLMQTVQATSLSRRELDALEYFVSYACQRLDTQALTDNTTTDVLDKIPSLEGPSIIPIACLAFVLSKNKDAVLTLDLLRCYIRLWLQLPEDYRSGNNQNASVFLGWVMTLMKASFKGLPVVFSSTINKFSNDAKSHSKGDKPAVTDPTTKITLSHTALAVFIRNFRLPVLPVSTSGAKPVIILALPNGPLLGIALIAVMAYYTAAPINITGGREQFRNDFELTKSKLIITTSSEVDRLGLSEPWVTEAGCRVLVANQKRDLTFSVEPILDVDSPPPSLAPVPNGLDDIAFILFTSGTSGTKKVVPSTMYTVLAGVACVIDSWGLMSADTCLNMMPLNHVIVLWILDSLSLSKEKFSRYLRSCLHIWNGSPKPPNHSGGIIRNLLAPILAGGCTVLCSAFDPNLFWDILEKDGSFTWYYASPSMHLSVLAEGETRPRTDAQRHQIRLICNAAGGLLPSLAIRLQETFHAIVLPSYGMTECMPISTPPLDYHLERTGTSGIGCGPEIAILDEADNKLPVSHVGRISVRGGPTFAGYLKDGTINRSAFAKNGWFDTGDLGYLDSDGYLYLTGRGKEVINRGGELISPFEVEDAIITASQLEGSPIHNRVREVLAFSAPHEVLQEVVGVVIVTRAGKRRPDIRQLQAAVKQSLHPTKWPTVVVYMDDLPKNNNKIIRIRLGERLGFDPLNDDMKLAERHFEAQCPAPNTPLSVNIPRSPCYIDLSRVISTVQKYLPPTLEAHVREHQRDNLPEIIIAPLAESAAFGAPPPGYKDDLLRTFGQHVDGYLVPSNIICIGQPLPKFSDGIINKEQIDELVKASKRSGEEPMSSPTEQKVRNAFAQILGYSPDDIYTHTDFFEQGGDSLSAGRLLSILRRETHVRIPVDKLFVASTVQSLSELIDALSQTEGAEIVQTSLQSMLGCTKTYSSTNPLLLTLQLLPIVIFYPMKLGFMWTILMYSLSTLGHYWSTPSIAARFLSLIASMFFARVATQIAAPVVGILFKWLVIGKYRVGMYPMWGPYHTRWWLVEKMLMVTGKGVFRYTDMTRYLYYRLLGAKIGKGVKIERGVKLGEYDLIEIGDNTRLDPCVCRPFGAERNTSMYLGRIKIGSNCSVGLKAFVAAGSTVPDNTCIGPNSSSYEMDGESEYVRDLSKNQVPKTHPLLQFLCIVPIQVIVVFISSLPWMGGLWGIVSNQPLTQEHTQDSVKVIIAWWATSERIGYHYLAQILNTGVRPFVWFALVVLIKKISDKMLGKAHAMPKSLRTQKDNFRSSLLSALIPGGGLSRITKMFGAHYEFTSIAVRLLGGKVGKRVYWPGTGPTIQDFDLIDVGDDVVFGSRSHIVTSDGIGSNFVRIENNAMVADRAVLLPGTTLRYGAILGSGALTQRDKTYGPNTVWVGSKDGQALCLSDPNVHSRKSDSHASYDYSRDETPVSEPSSYFSSRATTLATNSLEFLPTKEEHFKAFNLNTPPTIEEEDAPKLSPFGRAFYEGKANYRVINSTGIFLYAFFVHIFVQVFWNTGTIGAVLISVLIKHRPDLFHDRWYRPLVIYTFDVAFLSALTTILAIIAIAIVITAKWLLMGRRIPGQYDWDKSSYCQRWQIFLTIESIRRRCYGGHGIIAMLTGTHYAVLYFRALGATIGRDCALYASGAPNLIFPEPDLLELGDRVTVDDASLVAHINSRGNFRLNSLSVGARAVLRSGSRLLSGAQMGPDSCLLEHTLVMAGDVADEGTIYQGWPADVYTKDRFNVTGKFKVEKSEL